MANYFLAGVANAEIFDGDELFATAKTLVDSSITVGVSAEDIRAGQGAKLYGKYFHTSTFDLKMTDAMFQLEYMAANVGGEIKAGGDVFKEETIDATSANTITVSELPRPLVSGGYIYVYYKKVNDTEFISHNCGKTVSSKDIPITGIEANTRYCVKYVYNAEGARTLTVPADYIPKTLSVFLTANLYSGDASNPQAGTKAGTITIKIPRFLLSGSQEISMSMTGAANTPFEGSALATQGENCDDGVYAQIVEFINGRTYTDLVAISIEGSGDELEVDRNIDIALSAFTVYGRYSDSSPMRLNNGSEYLIWFDGDTEITNGKVSTPTTAGSSKVLTVKVAKYTKNDQGGTDRSFTGVSDKITLKTAAGE